MSNLCTSTRRAFIGLLPATIVSSAAFGQDGESNQTRSATIILLRHAEAEESEDRDPALSAAGRERAAGVAALLRGAKVTHLFSTDYRRTRETLQPLAESTGLEIASYDPRKPDAFVEQLGALAGGEVVVVAGHSNTVPQMVQALGGSLAGLDERGYLGHHEHDRVIVQTLLAQHEAPLRAVQTLDLRVGAGE